MIILDYTEDMEPYATRMHDILTRILEEQRPADQPIALTVYQGDYLELYHEDHLQAAMIDGMPIYGKFGGASRAITKTLEALLHRAGRTRPNLHVNITYIGCGVDSAEDQGWQRRRDRAIRHALRYHWSFETMSFGVSTKTCQKSIGFDAASNLPIRDQSYLVA